MNAVSLLVVCGLAASAQARIGVETYGTAARPDRVHGTIFMEVPPLDTRLFSDVLSTPNARLEPITFSSPVSVRLIGLGWGTWSGGYTGNAFYSNGASELTLGFPSLTKAVQLYVEPNPFAVFSITATGTGGGSASATQSANGDGGAVGWGFYSTDGSSILSILLRMDDGVTDFAVGDITTSYVPAPASLGLLGFAGLVGGRRRRA